MNGTKVPSKDEKFEKDIGKWRQALTRLQISEPDKPLWLLAKLKERKFAIWDRLGQVYSSPLSSPERFREPEHPTLDEELQVAMNINELDAKMEASESTSPCSFDISWLLLKPLFQVEIDVSSCRLQGCEYKNYIWKHMWTNSPGCAPAFRSGGKGGRPPVLFLAVGGFRLPDPEPDALCATFAIRRTI
jgi:hypothetical protein